MKVLSSLCLTLLPFLGWANMASPVEEGTWTASPFINTHADIMREHIRIIPDAAFKTARFEVEYHIRVEQRGRQIPLLFYAPGLREDFSVWVDGIPISLDQVPPHYNELEGRPFAGFEYLYGEKSGGGVDLDMSENEQINFELSELKFFEADLPAGAHVIRVVYNAERWTDHSGWVKAYSFRYALSPAQYWRSFGTLEITLDATQTQYPLATNLGTPDSGNLQTEATWFFDSLPVPMLEIRYQPEINGLARTLLAVSPEGWTLMLAVLLVVLHIFAMKRYRQHHPENRFSWVMITGSILVPLLVLLGYTYTYELIDTIIGPEASRYHGYTILVLFLYPVVLPAYFIAVKIVDWYFIRKWRRQHSNSGATGSL
ncbi:MAG: hypothetical protein EP344_18670 [Bacteroidetes bacterium]|nr:MAG: hypothetical protein EP344_18670 [Bacteroidota bacterium]